MKRKQHSKLSLWSCNVRTLTKARVVDLEKAIEKIKPEVLLLQETNSGTEEIKITGYKMINKYKRGRPGAE